MKKEKNTGNFFKDDRDYQRYAQKNLVAYFPKTKDNIEIKSRDDLALKPIDILKNYLVWFTGFHFVDYGIVYMPAYIAIDGNTADTRILVYFIDPIEDDFNFAYKYYDDQPIFETNETILSEINFCLDSHFQTAQIINKLANKYVSLIRPIVDLDRFETTLINKELLKKIDVISKIVSIKDIQELERIILIFKGFESRMTALYSRDKWSTNVPNNININHDDIYIFFNIVGLTFLIRGIAGDEEKKFIFLTGAPNISNFPDGAYVYYNGLVKMANDLLKQANNLLNGKNTNPYVNPGTLEPGTIIDYRPIMPQIDPPINPDDPNYPPINPPINPNYPPIDPPINPNDPPINPPINPNDPPINPPIDPPINQNDPPIDPPINPNDPGTKTTNKLPLLIGLAIILKLIF